MRFLCFVFLLLTSKHLSAAPSELASNRTIIQLNDHIVSLSDVPDAIRSAGEISTLPLPDSVIWIKLSLYNSTSEKEWLLDVDQWHKAETWYYQEHQLVYHKNGHLITYSERDFSYAHHNYLRFMFAPHDTLQIWIRLSYFKDQYIYLPQKSSLYFYPLNYIEDNRSKDLYLSGLILGMLVLAFFYNLFIYFSVKDHKYLYYLSIVLIGAYATVHNTGYIFEWLGDFESYHKIYALCDIVFSSLLVIFYVLILLDFLNLKTTRLIRKVLLVVLWMYALYPFTLFVFPVEEVYMWQSLTTIMLSIYFCFVAIYAYCKKFTSAGYFVIANFSILIGTVILMLSQLGIIPYHLLVVHSFDLGLLTQIVFFSLAFADRINVLMRDNEQKKQEIIEYYQRTQAMILNTERMKKEIATTKFESLKNQVNPHFLFNSLNILMELIDTNQEKAYAFTSSLSESYRYILSSRDIEVCTLEEEIRFLKEYFFLVKMRFGDNVELSIEVGEKDMNFFIVPLTLQLLVENCIKHNTIDTIAPLVIDICIMDDYLVVRNNLQPKLSGVDSVGSGLENIKNRYIFLTDKRVWIEKSLNEFTVRVPLLTIH